MNAPVTRAEAEDLLFEEADLLDQWKLEQWLALYTEDAAYLVPSTDLPADADPAKALFYIADDHQRMHERVVRLMKKSAHSEWPRSRTRHLVSNVRVGVAQGDETPVSAAFVTFRTKNGTTDTYMGRLRYRVKRVDGALRIREKRCELDLDGLRPHGRVSIIL
ncbi:MAG TPA: aromatic-ring-hydroxylating dioxygenase subunit beta [Rubrivivax sp.]|nr:aromatic-ring-hydroxylating dioxygenase subunit beta [Rubrivivax sp.]